MVYWMTDPFWHKLLIHFAVYMMTDHRGPVLAQILLSQCMAYTLFWHKLLVQYVLYNGRPVLAQITGLYAYYCCRMTDQSWHKNCLHAYYCNRMADQFWHKLFAGTNCLLAYYCDRLTDQSWHKLLTCIPLLQNDRPVLAQNIVSHAIEIEWQTSPDTKYRLPCDWNRMTDQSWHKLLAPIRLK